MGFLPEKFYFIHFDLISLEELSNATKRVDTFIEGIISGKSEITSNSAGDKVTNLGSLWVLKLCNRVSKQNLGNSHLVNTKCIRFSLVVFLYFNF